MISVDCSDALAIRDRLLVHVTDKLEALPILKTDKFVLDSVNDKAIEQTAVISAIEEFLESVELRENFQIIPNGDDIKIEPRDGKDMKEKLEKLSQNNFNPFFECTHCGFMSRYEDELRTHRLIHYI